MMKHENNKKSLSELDLLDNFLFGMLLSDERYQAETAAIILETIFDRPVKALNVLSERVIYPADTKLHGVRLDAIVEVEGTKAMPRSFVDLEPENKKGEKKLLPQRVRYYHSSLDSAHFRSGKEYDKLPKVWVIFITSFDPFDKNRMIYTFRNLCEEDPGLEYDDGARTIFLNVKGEAGDAPKKLVELLEYMADTTPEKACNEKLARIQTFVDELKTDPKVKEAYRMFNDYIMSERREAAEEERQKAEEERQKAEEERQKAEEEKKKAEEAIKKVQELNSTLENMLRNLRSNGMTEEAIAKLMT